MDAWITGFMTERWFAVQYFRDTETCEERDVAFLPYELAVLVTLPIHPPDKRRIGFNIEGEAPPLSGELAEPASNLYYLIGFREWAYRKRAVAALDLQSGDTVVEIACGTGLNFPLLQQAVGPEGRINGVDLTDRMLAQARQRADRKGWRNVDLVQADAATYVFPQDVSGIISTFALTLIPEFDEVIRRGAAALAPGGRWVVCDFKLSQGWAARLTPLLVPLVRPFGATLDVAERHPWESMRKYLENVTVEDVYLGFAYIAAGEAPGPSESSQAAS
jgi:demethylmenaquinone methyltransferase/2-methoxy-6-polyprenyl-1,4-benzoquinol methylase